MSVAAFFIAPSRAVAVAMDLNRPPVFPVMFKARLVMPLPPRVLI